MSVPPFMPLTGQELAFYRRIEAYMISTYPDVTVKHAKTQTAFARKVQFTWITPPLRKADAGGLMIYIALPFQLDSPRVLRMGYPGPMRYMHHILLRDERDFDDEICRWIEAAWSLVGCGRRGS